jgi:hypothetical protein
MIRRPRRPAARAGALATAVLLAAAACDDNALAPFQPEILNQPDSFQLQATGVKNVTTVLLYDWQNSGTTADVNQATVLTAGTATLTIRDDAGTEVYSANLTDNGTFTTAAGVTGSWEIVVALNDCDGDLNFRVEKP